MNLEKLEKNKWHIEHYDGCPAFTEMTACGFTKKLYGTNFPVYTTNIGYYKNKQGDWMSLISDQEHIGKTLIKGYIKDKDNILRLNKKWLKNFRKMLKFYYRLYQQDLSLLDDNELLKLHKKFYRFYKDETSMPGFIDGYMFYADNRFDNILKTFCNKNKISDYGKFFSALSAPVRPSFINEEEQDLEKIAKSMIKEGYSIKNGLKKFLEKNKMMFKKINAHLLKYSWIKSSYVGHKKYTLKQVEGEIKKYLSKKEYKEALSLKRNIKIKEKLIKKYKFTPEIIAISKLTELFITWQDQRKIYTLTFSTLQNEFLDEISRRTGIDIELLRYCVSTELKAILKGRFNPNELKKRKENSLFLYQDGKIKGCITGIKAKKFLDKVSAVDTKDIKEIKGLSASTGKVKGKVRVIKTSQHIHKVKQGDILVAPMTRPEHLVGMKKAAAIITDDGGITCHAAIVSRELGIPCIIGTKVATKVLKDGDSVEVDANKGIVKILK